MNPFEELILEHLGAAILIIVLLFLTIACLVWWCRGMWDKIKNLPCKENVETIKCHTDTIDRHKDIQSDLKASLARLEGKIDVFLAKGMEKIDSKPIELFSQKHSPRQLNAQGYKLYEDIQGEIFLNKNKDFFFEKIAGLKPQTAYDVENAITMIFNLNTDNEIFIDLKNWVYNAPSREVEINGKKEMYDLALSDLFFVLSLPLRDMYLSEHPEVLE